MFHEWLQQAAFKNGVEELGQQGTAISLKKSIAAYLGEKISDIDAGRNTWADVLQPNTEPRLGQATYSRPRPGRRSVPATPNSYTGDESYPSRFKGGIPSSYENVLSSGTNNAMTIPPASTPSSMKPLAPTRPRRLAPKTPHGM
jgi:hypothetical protein